MSWRYSFRALIIVAVSLQVYLLAMLLYWRHYPDVLTRFFQPFSLDVSPYSIFLIYYLLAALMLSCCLFLYSKAKYLYTFFILLAFCFFIPVFAGLAWLLLFMHFDHSDENVDADDVKNSAFDALEKTSDDNDDISLHDVASIDTNNPFRKYASLTKILNSHHTTVNERVSALLATRGLSNQQAIPLLKRAIDDKEDEVRLLAFSLLERREKILLDDIQTLELKQQSASERQRLLELYRKLIDSGLYEGGMQQYYEQRYQDTLGKA